MSVWKLIGSAPKDGTPIMAWADCAGWDGNFSIVNVAFHYGHWRIYGPTLGMPASDGKAAQWLCEVYPTHWASLPKPPNHEQIAKYGKDKTND